MEILTIKISEDELRMVIKEALKMAYDFSWSGWRLPIFLEDDNELKIGNWLSVGSWQPGIEEIYSVESWTIDNWFDSYGNQVEKEILSKEEIDQNIECEIDNFIDFNIEELKRKIDEKNFIIKERFDEITYDGNDNNDLVFYQYELV